MSAILQLSGVRKWVGEGDSRMDILQDISLSIRAGEFTAIMGASGSGKSTLLHLIGLLDQPSAGQILVQGHDASTLTEEQLAYRRAGTIGFIFQSFHLLPYLSALDNVMLPMTYRYRTDARDRARTLLSDMNLDHRLNAYPATLSGGERQRVAIARALANEPPMILADEPTGSLDSRSGAQILDVLSRLNHQGVTIVLVTHDPQVARRAQRTLQMKDGRLQ